MKHLILACLLAGCGGSSAQSTNPTNPTNPGDVSVASPDLANTPSTAGVSCTQEIALECAGGSDGCLTGATTVHVCVAVNTQVGASCSQEIALECPDGQLDACLESPPASANHVCILRS